MFATIGRFTARHRRALLLGWLALLVIGIVVGAGVFDKLKESNGNSNAESVQRPDACSTPPPRRACRSSRSLTAHPVDDPSTAHAVQEAALQVAQVPGITSVTTAYDSPDPALRAHDGTRQPDGHLDREDRRHDGPAPDRRPGPARSCTASVPGATVNVGGQLAVMHDGIGLLGQST